jgi:geranylgeranyl pyrophosphate synthase
MTVTQDVDGPFPFRRTDLEEAHLVAGVRHTLADFRHWRDGHPRAIADHVNQYTHHLQDILSGHRFRAAMGRRVRPRRRRHDEKVQVAREVNYFSVYNLGEVPDPAVVARIVDEFGGRVPPVEALTAEIDTDGGVAAVVDSLEHHLPALRNVPETAWLSERLDGLLRILPETVIRSGGMGKVIRATAGVLAIGAFDTLDDSPAVQEEHLARILPSAYALGAAYVIVDDTLQDLPGGYIPPSDKEWCHRAIASGLATGMLVDVSDLPDHPLAEELQALFEILLSSHPFEAYRHLYQAAEAMYLAQHRDATKTTEDVASSGLEAMYADILIKSGMSRVVANVLARRTLPDEFYARCLNTIVVGQFKDDLRDREQDLQADRLTPFTFPPDLFPPDHADANPLYDLFAYDAYVVSQVFHGDPVAADALTYFGSVKLANHLSKDCRHAEELRRRYEVTTEIDRYLRLASGLPHRLITKLEPVDTRIKDHCGSALSHRRQTTVDSRTYVADRLQYINDVTAHYCPQEGATGLDRIIAYAMNAPGKRLRPALGLMLAEGLGVKQDSVEPFVAAGELFHTASLMFDDLPAQDDAKVRRGRPTAHTVFDEGSVQLAAVSMISSGFGLLAQLDRLYPAHRVTEVIAYLGTALGSGRLCRGQDLDLHLAKASAAITGEDILEMYDLKTASSLEAALVPLMMLENRPPDEIELVKQYAHHAGIVFQIRDDVLDLTSSTDILGKDTENDVGKVNLVRVYGLAVAQQLMQTHLASAVSCCSQLPFDTTLLEGMVRYFAHRKK